MYIVANLPDSGDELYHPDSFSLEWTTEPPTVEGLYRVYHKNIEGKFKSGDWASWEEIKKSGDWLFVELCDDQEELSNYIKSDVNDGFRIYWLRPLPIPDQPQGVK